MLRECLSPYRIFYHFCKSFSCGDNGVRKGEALQSYWEFIPKKPSSDTMKMYMYLYISVIRSFTDLKYDFNFLPIFVLRNIYPFPSSLIQKKFG